MSEPAEREPSEAELLADELEALPSKVQQQVRHHIREMYPAAVEATPKSTFLRSVGNTVYNEAHGLCRRAAQALREAEARRWMAEAALATTRFRLKQALLGVGEGCPDAYQTLWGEIDAILNESKALTGFGDAGLEPCPHPEHDPLGRDERGVTAGMRAYLRGERPCVGCDILIPNTISYCPTCEAIVKSCEGKHGWRMWGGPRGRKFFKGRPWRDDEEHPWSYLHRDYG